MLHNRLAIIFLLTRRASTYGLGVSSSGSLDDELNGKTSENCNKCKVKNQDLYLPMQIPFTPYH